MKMCNWAKIKDKFSIWAFRSPESQLVKFSKINPIHPFERRAPGVYVFTHRKSNNLRSAIWILLACIAYFTYIGTEVATTFVQFDQIFFPLFGILISFQIIWLNLWPLTIVLNYPKFRYEYYIGEQIISVGPIVDAYVRLKVLFAGEEEIFYQIFIGATEVPEIEFTALSEHGDLYRKVAKRLAKTLHLNYFDIMDLSHLHECRHATSRHLESLLDKDTSLFSRETSLLDTETGIFNVLQKDIQRDHLIRMIDFFQSCEAKNPMELIEDLGEKPNWPFVKVEELNLGIPVEQVRILRSEKRAKETFSWILKQIPVKFCRMYRYVKIGLIGRSHMDDPAPSTFSLPDHEEELDEKFKEELIAQLDEAEFNEFFRRSFRWLLKFRTGIFENSTTLSVENRVMMRLVARYMALRALTRKSGQGVPESSENVEFTNFYTSHAEYSKFYNAEMSEMDPKWRKISFWGGRKRQIHPSGPLPTDQHVA